MDARVKLKELRDIINDIGPAVVAFSGGVDSTFLAKVATGVLKDKLTAVTVVTPFLSAEEAKSAVRMAKKLKVEHLVYGIELTDDVLANREDRCYRCKKAVFTSIRGIAAELGRGEVIEGSNIDDRGDYRPGKKALKELMVLSPLVQAGLTKEDIRLLSKEMGLETWNKPSCSCLATRVPYGEKITLEKLLMIDKAEAFLRTLGFGNVRMRLHGGIGRIEVGPEKLPELLKKKDLVAKKLRSLGIDYICADLEGYRSGSMNEVIRWKRKK